MHGSKIGLYVPDDVHREYPWEKSNLDPYRMTTRVHTAEEKGPCIVYTRAPTRQVEIFEKNQEPCQEQGPRERRHI